MQEISKFFDRIKNVALKEIHKREAITSIICKAIKVKIDPKDIEIRNSVITVKGSQVIKSEIYMKKKQIIDLLSKSGYKIVDIK